MAAYSKGNNVVPNGLDLAALASNQQITLNSNILLLWRCHLYRRPDAEGIAWACWRGIDRVHIYRS
jgi:hypothetical protein